MLERCLALLAEEDRLGDLAEAYAHDVRVLGEVKARRRYRRHVLSSIFSISCRNFSGLLQNEVPVIAAATLIALTGYGSLVRATEETWWVKSGFARNPGYFVSENQADDMVCDSRSVAGASSRVALLPKSARITKIYCGAPGEPIRLSDDNYTRGRVLTAPVAFRVVWED
jgi:hypothetical protein